MFELEEYPELEINYDSIELVVIDLIKQNLCKLNCICKKNRRVQKLCARRQKSANVFIMCAFLCVCRCRPSVCLDLPQLSGICMIACPFYSSQNKQRK
ncbi:hypothetical protein BpHYR1_003057 [Brachionus plicatilis]|uniref:Uncharacterized protein n=1 Tax=Brachionus plicatilis TaxID=10195 RepID=A0A3M7SEE5_BRAPC|nr:hypothetical protein BpHYR1_003057 [Brachionus plicatilis]